MSQKNNDGKRSARERLQEQRQREESRAKRKRTLIAGVVVVAVLGAGAGIAALVAGSQQGKDNKQTSGPVVAPQGAMGKDNLAIPVGNPAAKATLVVYEDFRCPACAQFENGFRETIHDLRDKNQLKAEYHLVALIDKNLRGSGSLNAANAAACAQDAGKFPAYHDELFKNQPPETDDAYGKKAKLLELAGKIEGLKTPAFEKCVNEGTHNSWVQKSQDNFSTSGHRGTPTVLLNGKSLYEDPTKPLTPQKFREMVAEAQKG